MLENQQMVNNMKIQYSAQEFKAGSLVKELLEVLVAFYPMLLLLLVC